MDLKPSNLSEALVIDGLEKKESCVASERFTNALNYTNNANTKKGGMKRNLDNDDVDEVVSDQPSNKRSRRYDALSDTQINTPMQGVVTDAEPDTELDTPIRLPMREDGIVALSDTELDTQIHTPMQGVETVADPDYDNINNLYIPPMQLSYYSLFGKYGFDMAVKNGEYILIPINIKGNYKAYIRKYNLGTTQPLISPGGRVTPTMGSVLTRTIVPKVVSKQGVIKGVGEYVNDVLKLKKKFNITDISWLLRKANVPGSLRDAVKRGVLSKSTRKLVNHSIHKDDQLYRTNAASIIVDDDELGGGNASSLKMRKKQTLKRQTKRPRKVTRKQIPRKTVRKTKRKW